MTLEPKIALRLLFLARVIRKECRHLATTDQRLFGSPLTLAQAARLEDDPDNKMSAEMERRGWA